MPTHDENLLYPSQRKTSASTNTLPPWNPIGDLSAAHIEMIKKHVEGMGATRDPELMEKVCNTTAQEMMATGIYWNYAPVVAVPQDIRWGRIYEGFSENTDVVSEMATACIKGMQSG